MPIPRELAHDLKNPLTVISGYADMLADGTLSEEQSNYIKKIQEASANLLKLIDDNKEQNPES